MKMPADVLGSLVADYGVQWPERCCLFVHFEVLGRPLRQHSAVNVRLLFPITL
jgi:hypothetical protein